LLALTLEVFRLMASPPCPKVKWLILSRTSDPLRRPFQAPPIITSSANCPRSMSSSPEVTCPSSVQDQRIDPAKARCYLRSIKAPVPPGAPSSYSVSHALGGLILTDPCDPVSCHCHSWGFDPSKHFPLTEPYLPRRQVIPSRRFLQQLRRTTSCALKALYPV
jgi:hypothetical protein